MKALKHIIILGIFALCSLPAAAQNKTSDADAKLARIDARIAQIRLDINVATIDGYLAYAESQRLRPDLSKIPGLNVRILCDSVPELKALDDERTAASEAYGKVLATDSKYKAIQQEYTSLKGVEDKARKNANEEQWNLLYERLKKNNPDYVPARDRRNETRRAEAMAVVRYLADYYKSNGREMPLDDLIDYKQRSAIRATNPSLGSMESELSVLQKLRRELYEQIQREELGLPVL